MVTICLYQVLTFNVKASGDITGSNVLFTGGKISGSDLKMEVPTFFLGITIRK